MEVTNQTLHDEGTDRDFDVMVYGSAGRAVIALPDWDFTCTSWENGGVVDALAELVDGGKAQLFCADSLDVSGWYGRTIDAAYRHENIVANLAFIEKTLFPFVVKSSSSSELPLLVGTGLGALNATILMLRHPELYGGLLALSGSYDARQLVDDFDDAWASLSPVDLAAALPARGKVVRTLRNLPVAFVCGQGGSETGIDTQRALDATFAEKKVGATFEYWGYDVERSWEWWCEEARQLTLCLIDPNGLAERRRERRVSFARLEAEHAQEVLEQGKSGLAALRERLGAASAELAEAESRYAHEQDAVATCAAEVERRSAVAREAWAERERVAQLLAEAQAAGDAAQADLDEASGDLSVAEWICGEAQAALEAATSAESALLAQVEEAESVVERAQAVATRAADELAEVNADVVKERAATKTAGRTRVAATKAKASAKRPASKKSASASKAPKQAGAR